MSLKEKECLEQTLYSGLCTLGFDPVLLEL